MPIQPCQDDGNPGFKFGETGTCYLYNPSDKDGMERSKRLAADQGRAIEANKLNEGNETLLAERLAAGDSGMDHLAKSNLYGSVDKELRGAEFNHTVDITGVMDLDDVWAWADGRGDVAVHPVFDNDDVGRRGILENKGSEASLKFPNDPNRNALIDYPQELEAVRNADKDFIAEVYAIKDGDSFKILLIDLLYWGDKKTELGFKDRRELLVDFSQQNLIGNGRFGVLEVRWIKSNSGLQDAVKWALSPEEVTTALAKSQDGPYPVKTSTPDWYEIRKDRDPLSQAVAKQLDPSTLLAITAMGFNLEEVAEEPSSLDPINKEKIEDVKVRVLKADEEKQYVLAVVLEPMEMDAQQDIMIPGDIEETAHDFLANRRVMGFRHKIEVDADVVESYIAPVDFEMSGEFVKKGSWLLGTIIRDKEIWGMVKSGEINGYSAGGFAKREEL